MENLPCEMIEHIFSYLPYRSHLSALEVCYRWKEIFETRVLKNTLLAIGNNYFPMNGNILYNGLQRLSVSTRTYRDLMFENIDFSCLDRPTEIQLSVLLANMGLHVLNLTLKDCCLSDEQLFLIVHLMKHMQTISIDGCQIHKKAFPVHELETKKSNIKIVSIRNITENEAAILDILTKGNSAEIRVTVDKSYIDTKTDVIERYARKIKGLSCMFSETRAIQRIFRSAINLERLRLHRSPSNELLYVTHLETISTQRNLQELSINMPISLSVLAEIAQNMPLLTLLEVTISDSDDIELITTKWPKLKVLSLSHSSHINRILHGMEFTNLEEIRLFTKKLTRNTVETIYKNCPGLKMLTLAALSMMRCENILGSIGDHLPDLVGINLQCSSRTTFNPFFKSIVTLRQLSSLSVCICDLITNKTMILINLPYLRTLKITRNVKISKEGLKDLFGNCPRILALTIRECPAIDDEAVKIISTCLPQLEMLDISESPVITLNSIRYIMENCKFLKTLKIENCRRLLIQWRNAPHYISSIRSLRSYYNMYPEFFYYHLPPESAEKYDSDDCFYYDSEADLSDIDDFIDNIDPMLPNSAEQSNEDNDIIIILSDDE